jgi:PQQ-dependent catabolism-associated beta-propeller protein
MTLRVPLAAVVLVSGLGLPLAGHAQVAYVSSEKDHALTVLDLKTQAVTGTIATCKRPRHLQLTPDGKQLAVACGDSHEADFIDLATRQSVRRVKLGQDPEIFDISADGKTLYVSNEEDAVLGIVDLGSGKRRGEVKVGGEPEGVKLSADGKTVYVTSEVANVVHAVDLASGKVVANIKAGKRPRRFALTPDGAQLWVSNELDASVTIIDTKANQAIGTIRFEVKGARAEDITPVGLTMTRDGRRAFVALGRANHVAFVDVATRKVTDLVLVGKRAWSVALDKAEKTLYVVNGLSDDLTIVDVPAAKALKTVRVGRVPHTVVVVE